MGKSVLIIDHTLLKTNNSKQLFESTFNEEFFCFSNKVARSYDSETFSSNEIFQNLIQRFLALEFFVDKSAPCTIKVKDNIELALYAKDISTERQIPFEGSTLFSKIRLWVNYQTDILASAFFLSYLMIRIPWTKESVDKSCDFAVVRTKAARSKLGKFDFVIEDENPYAKSSIYRLFSIKKRLKWVLLAWLKSYSVIKQRKQYIKKAVGTESSFWLYHFYKKRLVHTLLYEQLMEEFLRQQTGKTFYTANNLDRYSVIEEIIAKKYGLNTICIPHGIAYGFRFPKGFSCDTFYTYCKYSASYFNKLYDTNKFVYDEGIAGKMLKSRKSTMYQGGKVVYFSEPREPEVNKQIIEDLLPILKEKGLRLNIKFHPGDIRKEYSGYDIDVIEDLDEAISNNICFARKSTTLLEAAFSGSSAAAILLNEKDKNIFYSFPSLQAEKIKVTNSVDELAEWIFGLV